MPAASRTDSSQVQTEHPVFAVPGPNGLNYATWFIRHTKRIAIHRYRFSPGDAEDLEGDLLTHLMKEWPQFDESRSLPSTFIQNVVRSYLHQIVRTRFAAKRDVRRSREVSNAAEYGLLDGVRGQPEMSDHERIELRADIQSISMKLPDELQQMVALLQEHCPTEAAERMGISRTAFQRRLIELRRVFVAEGYGHGGDSEETSDQENA